MKGFTLLEVIVALIIASMAAVALLSAVGIGLHAAHTATMYDQAVVRAKSRLAAVTHGTALAPGDWRGDDGSGFRWHLRVSPVSSAPVRPVGVVGPRASASIMVVLYAISVRVSWDDGGTEREVALETEQVAGGAG